MASDCSQHPKEVAGISDMKVLAEMIGDLHYESLSKFLWQLSEKIGSDGGKDYREGKRKLGNELMAAGSDIKGAAHNINSAWQISKPFMEDKK